MKALIRTPMLVGSLGAVLLLAAVGCASTSPAASRIDFQAVPLARADRGDGARQIVVTFRDVQGGLAIEPGATAVLPRGATAYHGSAFAQRTVRQLAADYALERVADWYIEPLGVHCVVFRTASGDADSRAALIARLRADRRVESAQPMQEFRTSGSSSGRGGAAVIPSTAAAARHWNDPYFRLQRGIDEIGVPAAQRWSLGRGVRVAIVDTGLDAAHPDLTGRVESRHDFVDGDASRFARDRHGTAVAGAIAAVADNGRGIVGVAPQVRLLALRACWQIDGASHGEARCNSLTLAAALATAIEQRVDVLNLSLTGPADALLERLVARALAAGIVVVGALPGGQGGQGPARGASERSFPASVPGVVIVADGDARGPISPAGAPRTTSPAQLPAAVRVLAAPGREVLTLAPGGGYDYVSGPSMSTALVSGVVALMLERRAQVGRPRVAAAELAPAAAAVLHRTASREGGDAGLARVDACSAVAAIGAPARLDERCEPRLRVAQK